MARTRQKSKQRKAKRLEQERKVAERTQRQEPPRAATSSAGELAELEEAQREAAAEVQEAQRAAEVAASPEAAPVPVREAPPDKARRRERRRSEVVKETVKERQKEKEKARPAPKPERKREPRQRGRVLTFLVHVWAELRRVQWPTRNQVTQATSVVLVFCLIAGVYLGIWDFLFDKLVKAIL